MRELQQQPLPMSAAPSDLRVSQEQKQSHWAALVAEVDYLPACSSRRLYLVLRRRVGRTQTYRRHPAEMLAASPETGQCVAVETRLRLLV